MFKLTKLVTLQLGADRAKAIKALDGVAPGLLKPTLPGVYNGGDLIWHMQFKDVAAYRAAEPDIVDALAGVNPVNVESAAYEAGPRGMRSVSPNRGVYRTLLLSIRPGIPADRIGRFEAETRAMPDYIGSIGRWQFSRVSEASGTQPWTHVWEQEYADISGLHGPYMMHPYHWGHIDRWFDPECTDWIVDTYLCHTFCEFDSTVIARG